MCIMDMDGAKVKIALISLTWFVGVVGSLVSIFVLAWYFTFWMAVVCIVLVLVLMYVVIYEFLYESFPEDD